MGTERIVVVGASLAGLRAAETLRGEGFGGEVVVVGAEDHPPYDRPPLSKKVLAGEWEPERIALRRPGPDGELDVEWRLGVAAVGLDLDTGSGERTLRLADGSEIGADGCVVATGARCRRLAGQGDHPHVHELRTLDDSLRLRDELAPGDRRVVVVGAGFIGLEVAATARAAGNQVTVLEGGPAPLVRGLGEEMGSVIGRLHAERGVDVRCGVSIDGLHERGALLAGGEVVEADVVLVGIGVQPVTDWLEGSGVALRDGIVCDETLGALAPDGSRVEGLYAAGDVARWPNPLFGEEMRVEHWTNAAEQGAAAARNLLAAAAGGAGEPYAPVPFFWSDQYDHRVQFLGRASPDDEVVVVRGSPGEGRFLALYRSGDRLHGALGVDAPRWVMRMREPLAAAASWEDGLAAAAALD